VVRSSGRVDTFRTGSKLPWSKKWSLFSSYVVMMGLIDVIFYQLVNEKVFLYFGLFLLFLAANAIDLIYALMREYPFLEGQFNILSQLSFFSSFISIASIFRPAFMHQNGIRSSRHVPLSSSLL
jgi:hypothetical protein